MRRRRARSGRQQRQPGDVAADRHLGAELVDAHRQPGHGGGRVEQWGIVRHLNGAGERRQPHLHLDAVRLADDHPDRSLLALKAFEADGDGVPRGRQRRKR